ncbi:Sec1-binding region of Mso1-domain-containing protein [Boeremia exigua]|uniref:Sec1-binding region of Mso1-domain-containing protein n=1 Tax=Boeremia exigua TaxID=749465 RepID=UPI001E8E7BE5|nr:Sec1-binding region of Mso1-domain-containing protein [Boeremia exigua]KAH6642608.1 Sec1-binding region of Mso1-domain-containing protein [Boeremia exigua]
MSSYLNNLLTNTTSRYTNLRRQLLSDENDGDIEEDSHISRVLRAYYTEKGRPFPQWLPPDPRAPQAQPTQQFVSSAGRQQGQGTPTGRGGGLSDLWDNPAPQQQAQQPQSLRRGAGGGAAGAGARPLQGRMGSSLTPEPQGQGRPLPSQRAGSYQSSMGPGGRAGADPSPPPSAGSGTTAQERLKQRLWGSGRSASPAQSTSSVGSARGSYERPAPGGRPPYPDERSYSGGSSGGGRQQSGDYDPYAPTNYGGAPQRAPPGGRVGLPSGPRMR